MDKVLFLLAICFSYAHAITEIETDGIENRIAQGNFAVENQFPYMVSIQTVGSNATTRGHRCGGVLITYQHVLTSATCFFTLPDGTVSETIPASNYRVFGGSFNLTNDTNVATIRTIANYTKHPDFIRGPAFHNDILIVTLTQPFDQQLVTPIPLPAANYEPSPSDLCTVSGWGAVTSTIPTPSEILKYAIKYPYNQELCKVIYATTANTPNVFDFMLCAASQDVVSSNCPGDGGNAIICNGTLAGVLFYYNCGVDASYPELYTRVNNYTTWIRSITGAGCNITPVVPMIFFAILFHFVTSKVSHN